MSSPVDQKQMGWLVAQQRIAIVGVRHHTMSPWTWRAGNLAMPVTPHGRDVFPHPRLAPALPHWRRPRLCMNELSHTPCRCMRAFCYFGLFDMRETM